MFRGNQALLGVAKGSLASKLSLLWSFKTGGPVKSSPAIEQNQVFIGSGDGNVYALNFADGKKLWEVKTGGAIESSPLVLENKVYIGSSDSWLYALDGKSGKLSWKYQTGEKILGAPNWVKAGEELRILVGSYDFKLHCVEAVKGQVVWTYESGNYINGSPAVADNRTVFGGCDALLHVISLADGKQEKEFHEEAPFVSEKSTYGQDEKNDNVNFAQDPRSFLTQSEINFPSAFPASCLVAVPITFPMSFGPCAPT